MKAVKFIASWLDDALQVLQIRNRFISKQVAMVTSAATLGFVLAVIDKNASIHRYIRFSN